MADSQPKSLAPLYITMDEHDNVGIVANDGGLPAGTVFPCGLTLVEKVPQAVSYTHLTLPTIYSV